MWHSGNAHAVWERVGTQIPQASPEAPYHQKVVRSIKKLPDSGKHAMSSSVAKHTEVARDMSLIVDRKNIDFLLYDVFDLEQILRHPRFADHDRAAVTSILDLAETIAENEFLPCAAELDANEPRFVDGKVEIIPQVGRALRACAQAGFFSAGFTYEMGGMQLPATVTTWAHCILAAANISLANFEFLTNANAHMLAAFGTEEQVATFLSPMLEGRWFGTMCLSEPQAGSSLGDITTRAVPVDGRLHHITGSKMWISGGDHEISENIVHMVLAKRPDAPSGVKGISLFIVPKYRVNGDGSLGDSNNISLAGLNHKMGQRGTPNCLLNFGESGPTWGYLVGEPHQGLACMFHMMNEARIAVGANAAMSGLAGYLYALDYARTRPQGRRPGHKDPASPQVPIIEHADVRRMLLAQKAAVEGAMALINYCTTLVDLKSITDGDDRTDLDLELDLLTPVAKSWPSEHCLEANALAIQVLGGYGYTRDYPVERHYRDNRLNHIHEGTYGIHGLDLLGRKVKAHNGRALHRLLSKIRNTVGDGRERSFEAESQVLSAACDAVARATAASINCQDAELALANATLYLDAFGTVVVAWLWLEQGLAAREGAENGGRLGAAFYDSKIATCRYFFRYELPKVFSPLSLVESLDDTCLGMDPDAFFAYQ